MFFGQTGDKSILTGKINAIASMMGYLFQRQSDREFPRTRFSKGIKKGKLMGHEMTGLMLVLLATLRSTKGRETLLKDSKGKQREFFGREVLIQDWIMLLETLLQMEAWLMQPSLKVESVDRLKTKMKEVMMMTKRVGKRTEGMGFKTFNFHAALHVPENILAYGVPSNVNTMSNEMHHKKDKRAAKRTQRRPAKFDMQTAQGIYCNNLIDLAIEDTEGRSLWNYHEGHEHDDDDDHPAVPAVQEKGDEFTLTGPKIEIMVIGNCCEFTTKSAMKELEKFNHKQSIEDKLVILAEKLKEETGEDLVVHHELVMPNKQIYRASPHYVNKPWYDWALFNVTQPRHLLQSRKQRRKRRRREERARRRRVKEKRSKMDRDGSDGSVSDSSVASKSSAGDDDGSHRGDEEEEEEEDL